MMDEAITLDGVHPYIERVIEELNELQKYQYSLMFGLEEI